jgi:hypothetical protein
MPVADNILTLFQFEENVEPKIAEALAALGAAKVYTSRSTETQVTPSISVSLQMGGVTGHRFNVPSVNSDYWLHDQWNCSISGTTRSNRGLNATDHQTYRAMMRLAMNKIFETVNPLLDYHAFANIPVEAGTDSALDEENNHDLSIIRFNAVLAIKRDAWPTI